MLFNSAQFGIFFVIVCAVYWTIARNITARTIFLLVSSYFFYASWNYRYLILILGTSIADYLAVLLLGRFEDRRARKIILGVTVATNLGVLGFWKYTDFFVEN
ncbi:MAG: MBOAT family protein, partial [Deltaproteobacteria bacterium]|nr:MBOAT family protein [Deltaproteobacteria bacterium]